MTLTLKRKHNGVTTVISSNIEQDLGLVPGPGNWLIDMFVTPTTIYLLVGEDASASQANPDGAKLFYRPLTGGAWSPGPNLAYPGTLGPYLNLNTMQYLLHPTGRLFALETFSGEGGLSYGLRHILPGVEPSWTYVNLPDTAGNDHTVLLYAAGADRGTYPVAHGAEWLLVWDDQLGSFVTIPQPPPVPTTTGTTGAGFDLWGSVVVFGLDNIWAIQSDLNQSFPSPETNLCHLIRWNGAIWEGSNRLPIGDFAVDQFKATAYRITGRPGGGRVYVKADEGVVITGATWNAVKEVNVYTGEVLNVLTQDMTTGEWAFRGSPLRALGDHKPGLRAPGIHWASWGSGTSGPGDIVAFTDGSIRIGSYVQQSLNPQTI